jgi:hypothetical protein
MKNGHTGSNAASASKGFLDSLEWGEEFVVGVSRKIARQVIILPISFSSMAVTRLRFQW